MLGTCKHEYPRGIASVVLGIARRAHRDSELSKPEQFGWYTGEIRGDGFDDESIQPFETALKALLSDRGATLSKGVRGRDFVRQTYSYREFRTRLNAICREL